jgi:hypothetical protein
VLQGTVAGLRKEVMRLIGGTSSVKALFRIDYS